MRVVLDGIDMSDYFSDYNVSFSVDRVEGPNSGVSMAGSTIVDLVSSKTSITLTSGIITEEQFLNIVGLVKKPHILFEIDTGGGSGSQEYVVIPKLRKAYRVPLLGKNARYKNVELVLTER